MTNLTKLQASKTKSGDKPMAEGTVTRLWLYQGIEKSRLISLKSKRYINA